MKRSELEFSATPTFQSHFCIFCSLFESKGQQGWYTGHCVLPGQSCHHFCRDIFSSCLASANIKAQLGGRSPEGQYQYIQIVAGSRRNLSNCQPVTSHCIKGKRAMAGVHSIHASTYFHHFIHTSFTALCSDAPAENFTVKAYKAVRPGSAQP